MKTNRRTYVIGGLFLVIFAVVITIISRPVDDQLLTLRYDVRGELTADTNIVIVYLDNEDIQLLGGWPLQRSYYALMIDRMHTWGARVIGFDILVDSPSAISPEYDQVLVSVAGRTPSLVMIAYGRHLTPEDPVTALPDELLYSIQNPQQDRIFEIIAPFDNLTETVNAIGHGNVEGRWGERVPAFLFTNNRGIAAFGLEIVCRYLEISRPGGIDIKKDKLRLQRQNDMQSVYPLDREYRLRINHLGPLARFTTVRFPELMKETPEAIARRHMVKDKIVLVGIIAEGRSSFVSSPFTDNFPSIAHHATVIDNMLNKRLLRYPPVFAEILLTLLLTFVGVIVARMLPGIKGLLSVTAVAVLYGALTIHFFNQYLYILPLIAPLAGTLTGSIAMFVLYLQSFQRKLDSLEKEKKFILDQLDEREERLQDLHEELLRARQTDNIAVEQQLLNRVKRYSEEIRLLKTQVDDTEIDSSIEEEEILRLEELLYSSHSPMKKVIDMLVKVSTTDAPVLLLGESGTGKELAARAVHKRSKRDDKPFIAVNCGALTETLLESELFGHAKGAFTGAVSAKPGRFELADGGTIFLDEIAETSEAFQVKLLRVLQEGTFERVGGTETKKVNVRVIAATNRDIEQALEEKSFRLDLYYRLNVFSITLPPLRKRSIDIPILVGEFLKQHSDELRVSRLALQALKHYDWPGNVRELQSIIQRAALLAVSENRVVVQLQDLPPSITERSKNQIDIADQILEEMRLRKFSRSAISQTAKDLGDLNRGTVAEYLRGISLQTFVDQQFDIERTARVIAGTDEEAVVEKAGRKVRAYLKNITASINRNKPLEDLERELKGKYKNLPQRYHPALKNIIEAFHSGNWDYSRKA
jgi:transcriptional regulator with PAS, ATPase and Fis domain/CHASE2 domain-containing sensor protein